ncbi:MAG: S8 family serine peptidase [Candidatus Cybelea sp.]
MNALKIVAPLIAALAIAACSSSGSSNMPAAGTSRQSSLTHAHGIVPDWLAKGQARPVCPQVTGRPTCLALTEHGIQPPCVGSACGWAPIDLETRYKLPITKGSGQVVAIVDAGDNPDVATSIATYRTQFNLPPANFNKYNQEGQQSNYPTYTGWSVEIALDVDMVSAACPLCTIDLVEANSSSSSDLDAAELEAVNLGAHVVSNSWICYGSIGCVDNSDFDQPGVVYTAGSGDSGYNQNGAPEALDTVVSVGGTQLAKTGSTYSETIWNGAGGGCATGETKPTWQHDPGCTSRTDADISAEAGCSPGVAVYDQFDGGWGGVCGTSAATPLAAAIFGLAGNASSQNAGQKFWMLSGKQRRHDLHPILLGNDGQCSGEYLCTAGTHQFKDYSGPGGWGSPKGLGAF